MSQSDIKQREDTVKKGILRVKKKSLNNLISQSYDKLKHDLHVAIFLKT